MTSLFAQLFSDAAAFQVNSTTKGFLPPLMTNTQISTFESSLGASDKGMIVFYTDDTKLEYWDGTLWKTMLTKTSYTVSSSDGTSYCSEGVTDYSGHKYKTVKIGDQCWMAENLKSNRYADSSSITGQRGSHSEGRKLKETEEAFLWTDDPNIIGGST